MVEGHLTTISTILFLYFEIISNFISRLELMLYFRYSYLLATPHTACKSNILPAFMILSHSLGDDPDCAGGVKTLVMKQVCSYKKLMPKKSFYEHPLPGLDSSRNQSTENIGDAVNQPLGTRPVKHDHLLIFFYTIFLTSAYIKTISYLGSINRNIYFKNALLQCIKCILAHISHYAFQVCHLAI